MPLFDKPPLDAGSGEEPQEDPNKALKFLATGTDTSSGKTTTGDASEMDQFPVDDLPPVAAAMAKAVSEVFQAPPEIAAMLTLGVMSAALGKGLELNNPPYRTRGNLFIICGARSGVGKSSVFNPIFRPLFIIEQEMQESAESRCRAAELRLDILQKDRKRIIDRGGEPEERESEALAIDEKIREAEAQLVTPRMLAEDETEASLADLLNDNREQTAIVSSESGAVLANWRGRFNDADKKGDTFFLKAFSGDPHSEGRRGGRKIVLKSPCMVVVLLMVLKDVDDLFSCDTFREGGLLARFLVCRSVASIHEDDGVERELPVEEVKNWDKLIRDLVSTFYNAEYPAEFRETPEAREVFRQYHNTDFVQRAKSGDLDGIEQFAQRGREIARRIAVVLHAGDLGAKACDTLLPKETAERAVRIHKHLSASQREGLASVQQQTDEKLLNRLYKIFEAKVEPDSHGWGRLSLRELKKNHDILAETLEGLARRNPSKAKVEEVKTGARPSRVFALHIG